MLTLFVPLSIAALGIVLRGAGFAFRKVVPDVAEQRVFGIAFAASSVIVPFCFGAVVGGVVSGRVPAGGRAGDSWTSWIGPVVGCRRRAGRRGVCVPRRGLPRVRCRPARATTDLVGYFRRRAIGAAVVAGVLALVGFLALDRDAAHVHRPPHRRGLCRW